VGKSGESSGRETVDSLQEKNVKVEEYSKRQQRVRQWKLNIVSYRLGDQYYCTVDNVEPGATLERAQGLTRDEAEAKAFEKAEGLLAKTLVMALVSRRQTKGTANR
jgi:hypothetical protein